MDEQSGEQKEEEVIGKGIDESWFENRGTGMRVRLMKR